MTCDDSWIYCCDPEIKRQSSQWKQTQDGQTEQIQPQTFDDPIFDSTGIIYMHWVPTGQTVNKEYYVEVLRGFRKRFRRKRPALFKSGQWHFHQDNTQVHNSILVTDYLTKMDIKTVPQPPYSPDLAPCDFWLFPKLKEKLRGCRYDTIEKMVTQKDFHEAFQKLLERYNKCIAAGGDYFERDKSFMCVLSIIMSIRKKSGNLFNEPCIYICSRHGDIHIYPSTYLSILCLHSPNKIWCV